MGDNSKCKPILHYFDKADPPIRSFSDLLIAKKINNAFQVYLEHFSMD